MEFRRSDDRIVCGGWRWRVPAGAVVLPAMRQLAFEFPVPSSPSLDNFVAGRNAELVDQCLRGLRFPRHDRTLRLCVGNRRQRPRRIFSAGERSPRLRAAGAAASYVACHARRHAFGEDCGLAGMWPWTTPTDWARRRQMACSIVYNTLRERQGGAARGGDAPPVTARVARGSDDAAGLGARLSRCSASTTLKKCRRSLSMRQSADLRLSAGRMRLPAHAGASRHGVAAGRSSIRSTGIRLRRNAGYRADGSSFCSSSGRSKG